MLSLWEEGGVVNPADVQSLWVGNLADTVEEMDLYMEVTGLVRIISLKLVRDRITQVSKGYAYVNLHNKQDADTLKNALNHKLFHGNLLSVQYWRKNHANEEKVNVFVRHLPDAMTAKQLEDLFSQFGEVLSAKIPQEGQGLPKESHLQRKDIVEQEQGNYHDYDDDDDNNSGDNEVLSFFFKADEECDNNDVDVQENILSSSPPLATMTASTTTTSSSTTSSQSSSTTTTTFNQQDGSQPQTITSNKTKNKEWGKHYGYVLFATHSAAQRSVNEVCSRPLYQRKTSKNDLDGTFTTSTTVASVLSVNFFKSKEQRMGDLLKSSFTNVYVRQIPDEILSKDDIVRFFSEKYGPVTSSALQETVGQREDTFLRACFINFEHPEAAKKCVDEMHNKPWPLSYGEGNWYVARALKKEERSWVAKRHDKNTQSFNPAHNVFIRNIPESATESDLVELFSSLGTHVVSVNIKQESNIAYVAFSTHEEAAEVVGNSSIGLHGSNLLITPFKSWSQRNEEKEKARFTRIFQRFHPQQQQQQSQLYPSPYYGHQHQQPQQPQQQHQQPYQQPHQQHFPLPPSYFGYQSRPLMMSYPVPQQQFPPQYQHGYDYVYPQHHGLQQPHNSFNQQQQTYWHQYRQYHQHPQRPQYQQHPQHPVSPQQTNLPQNSLTIPPPIDD
eukprot:m.63597 g.63597  ORF g.63597 m.63597 type:complete len:670 (+) comp8079_c0_seq1:147-2156(+)